VSLLDYHLDNLGIDPIDPSDHCDEDSYDEARDEALTEAVSEYVGRNMTFDEQVELLKESSHLKFMYDDPAIDTTSFDRIAASCAHNLLEKSYRARNS